MRAILNKSWRQHPTRHQLYGHLPPITKTIQVRRTRHAGHCWRSKDELISDVLLWTPTYGQAKAGRPARTYIQQLCEDTRCNPEDMPEAMNNREKWRERVRDIRAGGRTWWWWWYRWHWNLETRKTLRLLSSGTKLFIIFEFKGFSTETQFFYANFSICPKPRAAPVAKHRRAPKVNLLLRRQKLNSLTFLKSPKSSAHASGAWRHSNPPVIFLSASFN